MTRVRGGRRSPVLGALAAAAVLAASARAGPGDGDAARLPGMGRVSVPAEGVEQRLRELGRAQAAIRTLRAHFVQEKRVAIVRGSLRSSGTFVLDKRGLIAWDVKEPEPMRVRIGADGVFADGKRVGEAAPSGLSPAPILRSFTALFGGVSEGITRDFDAALAGRDRLRLVPRSPELAKWVRSIELRFDERGVPVEVRFDEPGGDSTEIRFTDVVLNPKLEPSEVSP